MVRELCDYWAEHDWPTRVAELNRLDHARTAIDGLDIHFVHLRSPTLRRDSVDLDARLARFIWGVPAVAKLLTEPPGEEESEPTTSNQEPIPAFHVVLPSLPGFAFSDKPTEPGWNAPRIAEPGQS